MTQLAKEPFRGHDEPPRSGGFVASEPASSRRSEIMGSVTLCVTQGCRGCEAGAAKKKNKSGTDVVYQCLITYPYESSPAFPA